MEKHALTEYTLRKQGFRGARLRISPRNDMLPLSFAAEFSRKASGNDLSQPFFHAKSDATRAQVGGLYPRGDSSYQSRPRPAYQELPRVSALSKN